MADKEGARKSPLEMVVCTSPDVCKTPMGPATPPVPYPIVGMMSTASGTANSVEFTGMPCFTMASKIPAVIGDEAGVAAGVKSGTVKGTAEPQSSSSTVYAQGALVCRHDDPFGMNNGNTSGKLVCPEAGAGGGGGEGEMSDATAAPEFDDSGTVPPESEALPSEVTDAEAAAAVEEKGALHQLLGVGRGIRDSVVETVEGVETLVREPGQVLSGLAAAAENPGLLWDAVTEGYKAAWAAGEYGEAVGRGIVDVGGMLLGGGAAAKGGAKAGQVADKVADLARAGDKITDASRGAAVVGDGAKAARVTEVTATNTLKKGTTEHVIRLETGEVSHIDGVRVTEAGTARKGIFGQKVTDLAMEERGYRKVGGSEKAQGIDGVYMKDGTPPEYVVVDSKYGSSQLSQTLDGKQMSTSWIDNRLDDAVGPEVAAKMREAGYNTAVSNVDEFGNVTMKQVVHGLDKGHKTVFLVPMK